MRRLKAIALSCLASSACAAAAAESQIELPNPSFEKGSASYWISRPDLATIDEDRSTQGAKSLRFDLPAGKETDLVLHVAPRPGEAFRLEFDCVAEGAVVVRVKTMLSSDGPVRFWTPRQGMKSVQEMQPTDKWTRFKCVFGPLPEEAMGKEIKKIAIYLSVEAEDAPSKAWLDNLSLSAVDAKEAQAAQPSQAEKAPAKRKAESQAAPTPKAKEEPAAAQSDEILITMNSPVQVFEKPAKVKASLKSASSDGSTLRLTARNFRGETKLQREGKQGEPVEFELTHPGYYLVEAEKLKDGKAVASRASSLCVTTPLPEDYYSTPEPAFGVWGIEPELLRAGGGKWTRKLFFTFFQKPDFKAEEPSKEALEKRGPVKVIECLNVLNPFKRMTAVPQEDWPGLLEKLGKEIKSKKGLVDVWETQNEPMVGENFHGTMADAAEIMAKESGIVRSLDPGRPVAAICINPMNANQRSQILGYYRSYGMDKISDGAMLHPYIPNAASPESAGYAETLRALSRDLKAITGKDVPLYISEIGYSTKPGGEVSELQQAAYLVRVALLNRTVPGLKACVWHIGLWNEATSQRELDYGVLRGHPKGSPLREPKPAFAAWATMSRETYDANYICDLDFGRGVKAALFERKGAPLLIAFSLSKTPKSLKAPLPSGKALATDLCGSKSSLAAQNGILTLEVDEAPVYIAGAKEDMAALKGFKVAFSPEELRAKPGETAKLSLSGESLDLPGASLETETPQGWSSAATGSGKSRELSVKIPEDAEIGERDLFIHLKKDGESKRVWRREISVVAPIELKGLKVLNGENGEATLEFLPEAATQGVKGGVKIYEDSTLRGAGEFMTNKPSRVVFALPAYGRPRSFRIEISDGRRKPWSVPEPLLGRFAVPSKGASFDLANGTSESPASAPKGRIALAWNSEGLKIDASVENRWRLVKERPEEMFGGDSLQIGFAVPQAEMIHPNNDGIQETQYTEFGLMPSPGGLCKSWTWASSNRNLAELSAPLPGVQASWTRKDETLFYSALIPWTALNVKSPRPGLEFKFSALLNYADESGKRHFIEWWSGIANGKDPSLYGDALLAE